ncbi:MAG: thioredoxin family protein [Prolixibacteraceae bacterium]
MKKLVTVSILLMVVTFVQAQKWETSFDVARSRSNQEGKNIVLVFSGSDWCIPCMKLEKFIWESQDFVDYSREHFVLLRADFPKKKANALSKEQQDQNDKLAELYNKQGLFPLVVVLNKNAKVLGTTSFKNIPPGEYIALLHSFEKN